MLSFKQYLIEATEPKTCRSCGEEFKIKRTKFGFVDQCDDCGRDEEQEAGTRRHVGTITGIGKQAITNIIRNPSETMTQKVRMYNTRPRVTSLGSSVSNFGITGERSKANEPK